MAIPADNWAQPSFSGGLRLLESASKSLVLAARDSPRRSLLLLVGATAILLIGLPLLQGTIYPNVWSLGTHLGGLTIDQAMQKLTILWENSVEIRLHDGVREWTARPSELGLTLNAAETAARARNAGLSGVPFGIGVVPVVTVNQSTARAFLETVAIGLDSVPQNAGFEWRDDQLFGIPGNSGRRMNVDATLASLVDFPALVSEERSLELIVDSIEPDVLDATPFLEQAYALVSRGIEFRAYDPIHDETIFWTTMPADLASWLETRSGGLTLKDGALTSFIAAQNVSLETGVAARYIDRDEAVHETRASIEALSSTVPLRVRHRPSTYTVVAGDSGYRIARKIGVPYYLLEQANTDRDLSVLSPGDTVNAPSPDAMVPLEPVSSKRIVVDLERQFLAAYENGEVRFSWPIASGIEEAPTSSGIFQVLSHVDVAYGSSYSLCNETGCGQWELNWFMGIYEVVPGLMNGFHGAVLLPNGRLLGDGNVGSPATLGCVMSRDEDARALYEWADEGTVVEIISSEFEPRSALGQRTVSLAANA
jgi:LysM repeat protein